MITLRHGACCSMSAAMPGRMEFRSIRAVRNPWKEGWIAADINVGLAGIED
jgi:hypothetical protein